MSQKISRSLVGGLSSGVLLGLILGLSDRLTDYRLLRLLLDVSFLPLPGEGIPLLFEWALHLITSILICLLFLQVASGSTGRRRLLLGLTLGGITSLVYLPLSRVTGEPPPLTPGAPALWLVAHLIYGLSLVWLTNSSAQDA